MNFNPVLSKELKVKMRNWKAAGMIGAYLLVLTLVAVFVITIIMSEYASSGVNKQAAILCYGFLATIQFLLIIFIAPALTSGAISGERERQTLDLLLCTKLTPRSIILGKLFSSISQVILLIIASFPIFATVFIFGGISVGNLLELFLFYLVTALLMGSIGIFFSTYIKKTTTSNVVTYAAVLFILFGTIFLTALYMQIFNNPAKYIQQGMAQVVQKQSFFPLLYLNPLIGFGSLILDQFGIGTLNSMPIVGRLLPSGTLGSVQPWVTNTIINFLLAIGLFILASFKVNPIRKKLTFDREKIEAEAERQNRDK